MQRKSLPLKILKISVFVIISVWLFMVLFSFWRSDLSSWDTPGHLFASFYYKEYLWPKFHGWNHLSFGGYPQGYFYPSLFHWLVGGLGKLFPLTIVFKTLLSLSIIFLPISIYFWLKSLGIRNLELFLAIIWVFIFLNIVKFDIGGDFYSTFTIGLVTFQFTLPFYFFYLYFLQKGVDNIKNLFIAAFILGGIVISHSFIALAAFLSSFVYFFLFYLSCPKKFWFFYLTHLVSALLLASFWVIPFFYFSNFSTGAAVGKAIPIHPLFLLIFIISLCLIIKKKDEKMTVPLALLVAFLMAFAFGQYFMKLFPSIPLHLYRFIIFIYFLISVIISRLFINLKVIKTGIIISLIILVISSFVAYPFIFPHFQRRIKLNLYNLEDFLGIVPSQNIPEDIFMRLKAPHALSQTLLLQKNKLLNGLFVESSINSKAIQSLIHELYDQPFTWGVHFYQPNSELLKKHLNYLGVCWLMSYTKLENLEREYGNEIKIVEVPLYFKVDGKEGVINIFLYALPSCSPAFITALPETLNINQEKEWDKAINDWWSNPKLIDQVIIQVLPEEKRILEDKFIFEPNTQIELVEKKEPFYYKFRIKSQTPQFVYLKIPYFPNWKAYQNKKEIKIFRASPNFLVLKAEGEVEIRFVPSKIETFSGYLSLVTALILFLLIYFYKNKKMA